MSNINFNVVRVFAGTEGQKKVGIYATFTMNIEGPDGIIAVLSDMKLMKSKNGDYYIDAPFRQYDTKDKETGQPKKAKLSYIKLFPEQKNWSKKDAIVKLVLDEISNNDSRPVPKARSQPSVNTPQNDPW